MSGIFNANDIKKFARREKNAKDALAKTEIDTNESDEEAHRRIGGRDEHLH